MNHTNTYDIEKINNLLMKIEEKIGFVSDMDREYVTYILLKYLVKDTQSKDIKK